MDMKERLKQARIQRGLTQERAGELVGVTENSIYRYEAGTVHPSETALKMMAQVYGQPVEWLSGDGPDSTGRVAEPLAPFSPSTDIDRIDGELGPVTLAHEEMEVIGAISARVLVEGWQQDLGQVWIPRQIIRASPNAFALRVYGDSLIPDGIVDGDIVVVDPDAGFVEGRIYAVQSEENHQTIAARRVYDMGRRYKLVSGDGSAIDVLKSRTTLLGRIRWSVPNIREH